MLRLPFDQRSLGFIIVAFPIGFHAFCVSSDGNPKAQGASVTILPEKLGLHNR